MATPMDEQDAKAIEPILTVLAAYPGLQQLICAALADQGLTARLLVDPAAAIEPAVPGVALTENERKLIASVSGAADIHEFAEHLYQKILQA